MPEPSTSLSQAANAYSSWARMHPGDPPTRQPVHTVYGGADLFRADTARRLGDLALRSLETYAPDPGTLASAIGLDPGLAETVRARVKAKLETEPVEDFRIDFEDGFGNRPDDEEDAAARQAGREVARGIADGTLPPFIGIRVKPFSAELAARAARTLDLFLSSLLEASGGRLPEWLFVTDPKVVVPEQVAVLADLLDGVESRSGLAPGTIRLEIMVETPASILGPDGNCPLPALVAAGRGRCAAAHFGV